MRSGRLTEDVDVDTCSTGTVVDKGEVQVAGIRTWGEPRGLTDSLQTPCGVCSREQFSRDPELSARFKDKEMSNVLGDDCGGLHHADFLNELYLVPGTESVEGKRRQGT